MLCWTCSVPMPAGSRGVADRPADRQPPPSRHLAPGADDRRAVAVGLAPPAVRPRAERRDPHPREAIRSGVRIVHRFDPLRTGSLGRRRSPGADLAHARRADFLRSRLPRSRPRGVPSSPSMAPSTSPSRIRSRSWPPCSTCSPSMSGAKDRARGSRAKTMTGTGPHPCPRSRSRRTRGRFSSRSDSPVDVREGIKIVERCPEAPRTRRDPLGGAPAGTGRPPRSTGGAPRRPPGSPRGALPPRRLPTCCPHPLRRGWL